MIRIGSDAREHIERHGGAVTLRGTRRHGCCGGTAFVPVAEPGPPMDPERYRAIEIDGITVFARLDMETDARPIRIGLDELWGWKRLRVDGTAIWMQRSPTP